jgi:UDP-N-acetyl-D-glucosamine dehydrogenase
MHDSRIPAPSAVASQFIANDSAELDTERLVASFIDRTATIGVIGLGYVGLPLSKALCHARFPVIGLDIDPDKVKRLNAGISYFRHMSSKTVEEMRAAGFRATADFAELASADAIIICVPTPLTRHREPDMTYIERTAEAIRPYLRRGQLIVLESTTYPGTTTDVMRPILEESGLRSGADFFVAYSPEREDPGNQHFSTTTTPKVVGGDGVLAQRLAEALYSQIVKTVVVSSAATAEAVKLTENIFRCVNIALVNELKVIYERMGINIWEVIDAAKSKPFGYMPFYPGPGLGGHCIPIDPFYLTWKAREFEVPTRFIELAGEINTAMPSYVVQQLAEALDRRFSRGLSGSRILLLGVAYKKNVDDSRESPAFKLIELLEARGATVEYYDSWIPEIGRIREHPNLAGRKSVMWDPSAFASYDAALICTDHDGVDYDALAAACRLVVDTRNATRACANRANIVRA